MVNDPYSGCPCGSGKKFKWCCQPIHEQIAKIYALDESGQHEAALRMMDEVTAQHASNPEVWGRKALLLFQNEKPEDAEKALDKAFELFPTYPFGFFLKARFRLFEGEIAGALLLLRKAADLYDPNAADLLAQIYVEIFECEMKLNHPIAAHAAAELAMRFNPASDDLRKGIAQIFSKENPNLPASAWQKYAFKPLPATATAEVRAAWEGALKTAATGRLVDAAKAFEMLTKGDAVPAAAWFNLGLTLAWSGSNTAAVGALEKYVVAEPDEAQAAQAWALAEVLRFGQGMEDYADVVEYSAVFGVRDPQAFVGALGELEQQGLLAGARVNEQEGVLTAIVLEPPGPALTPELTAKQNVKLAAYVTLMSNFVRLWHTNRDSVGKVFERFQQKLGGAMGQVNGARGPAKFADVLCDAITVPRGAATQEEAEQRMREGSRQYFEEQWVQRPLKSLGNLTPADAATQGVPRKKLRGVLQLLRECGAMTHFVYDFDQLFRKLGLLETIAAPQAAAPEGAKTLHIAALGAAELAALPMETLNAAELDLAYQTALKLDARDLAGTIAAQLVETPRLSRAARSIRGSTSSSSTRRWRARRPTTRSTISMTASATTASTTRADAAMNTSCAGRRSTPSAASSSKRRMCTIG